MDYATPNKGVFAALKNRKAKAAAPKRRAVSPKYETNKRCGSLAAGQPALSPCGAATYGFLKCQFLPLFTSKLPALKDDGQEEDFYSSFTQLCGHYSIAPLETRSLGYPYSRAVALWAARQLLRESQSVSIEISNVADDNGRLLLLATETYCTGNTLYFIPVVPLYHLLQARSTKKAAELLLCTCAYLYHRAGIPYYRDEGNYLSWHYEMLRQWVEDDPEGWEQDSLLQNRSQFNTADHIGDVMQRKVWNPCHLTGLSLKIKEFTPKDSFGQECLAIARQTLCLLEKYPNENLYRNADESVLPDYDADEYAEEECITMDKYISFCAETQGWLYSSLSESVNSEFGECNQIQEPVLRHRFDGSPQQKGSLDFEARLFSLMENLCYILNNYDYGNNE